jgi:hypothetical protein
MRSTTFFAALIVVVAGGALIAVRYGMDARTAEPPGTATLVGDSLNVGVERYIADTLPRWRILANDQVGRTTSDGIAELVAGRATLSPYLVVSLGTNDGHDVEAFRASVARVLRLAGPDRCVVWATIWRDGRPSDDFNDVLREAAETNKRLRLVAWAEMVEQRPELLAADGLHGNETGYRERARAVADAVGSCSPGETVAKR